jgi:hypothetical protein
MPLADMPTVLGNARFRDKADIAQTSTADIVSARGWL